MPRYDQRDSLQSNSRVLNTYCFTNLAVLTKLCDCTLTKQIPFAIDFKSKIVFVRSAVLPRRDQTSRRSAIELYNKRVFFLDGSYAKLLQRDCEKKLIKSPQLLTFVSTF